MSRATYDQRQAFRRLVRINDFRGLTRARGFGLLRSLYQTARGNPLAGAYSGYSP